jgi:hypothetical protein
MATGHRVDLLSNASATGSAGTWPGGKGAFLAEATWGGGTIKLQMQTPQGTWVDVADTSLTANGHKVFEIPAGQIRANLATATAAYAWAVRI